MAAYLMILFFNYTRNLWNLNSLEWRRWTRKSKNERNHVIIRFFPKLLEVCVCFFSILKWCSSLFNVAFDADYFSFSLCLFVGFILCYTNFLSFVLCLFIFHSFIYSFFLLLNSMFLFFLEISLFFLFLHICTFNF